MTDETLSTRWTVRVDFDIEAADELTARTVITAALDAAGNESPLSYYLTPLDVFDQDGLQVTGSGYPERNVQDASAV